MGSYNTKFDRSYDRREGFDESILDGTALHECNKEFKRGKPGAYPARKKFPYLDPIEDFKHKNE